MGPQPRAEHVALAASGASLCQGDRTCARPRAWRRRGKCASPAWHLDGHSRVPMATRLPSAKLATGTEGAIGAGGSGTRRRARRTLPLYGVAGPARLYRRGALGVGRLIGGEPSSEIDGRVLGSIGSGVAKAHWRHVTTAIWQGVEKDLVVPLREVALVVAAPGAVLLEAKGNVGATKARRRRRTPVRWRWSAVVAPA